MVRPTAVIYWLPTHSLLFGCWCERYRIESISHTHTYRVAKECMATKWILIRLRAMDNLVCGCLFFFVFSLVFCDPEHCEQMFHLFVTNESGVEFCTWHRFILILVNPIIFQPIENTQWNYNIKTEATHDAGDVNANAHPPTHTHSHGWMGKKVGIFGMQLPYYFVRYE